MHILLAHDYYQIPGGEDDLFESTRDLLRERGHRVTEYVRHNNEIAGYGALQKLTLAARTTWAWDSARELRELIARDRPDVVHFGSTFPLISPAAYYACKDEGVPVVQTLDNPRLGCPAGTFLRDGKLCEDCAGGLALPAIVHSCYRDSAAQTAVVSAMLGIHRVLRTWKRKVDAYLVATHFYIRKFIELGLPAARMHYRPLFIKDPGMRTSGPGDYALYLGRLASEKGIRTVLEAWKDLDIPLKIRGSGPLEAEVREFAAGRSNIEIVPRLSHEAKYELVRKARFLVWPSVGYYETFGLVVADAYASGVPVIASRTGVATEMVFEGHTGLFFQPLDGSDLARQVRWAWEHPAEMEAMGRNGRPEFEAKFSYDAAYNRMMSAYAAVVGPEKASLPAPAPVMARQD